MSVFPKGKHDDQVDSTAQFLDWFKKPFPCQGIYEYHRQEVAKPKRRGDHNPSKASWAKGSME
jgi:hypothetical protein